MLITSRENPLIKKVLSLQRKKGRQKHKLFLAEGPHLVQEALICGFELEEIILDGEKDLSEWRVLIDHLEEKKIPLHKVSSRLFADISETETPQGIIGLAKLPYYSALPEISHLFLGLILDGIQDPGNVGTIIRTSWGAGMRDVFITPGTADPYSGKVVRSSQGGVYHIRIYNRSLEKIIEWAGARRLKVWVGAPDNGNLLFKEDFTQPGLILLGNEARGPQPCARQYGTPVNIPLPGGAESLNVSVAAGVIIFEALRQRLNKSLAFK